jgi:hypothetical protein
VGKVTSWVGRMTVGFLVSGLLLLPARLSAHGDEQLEEMERLEQRVWELEQSQVAQEDATRSIIRDTVSSWGSKINEFVNFGGTLEVLTGWEEDFDDTSQGVLRLDTAELDFEIQVNDWVLGSLIIEYIDGQDLLFTSTENDEAGLDRINIDTGYLVVGNTQRFWPFGVFGRMIVPFGISTGDPVADVLTIEDPLTIEIFETREDAILLGVEFPTPPLGPALTVPSPPPVRPVALNPLFTKLARGLGYRPLPTPPPTKTFMTPTPTPPPFSAGVYVFNGTTHERFASQGWRPKDHLGATLGYRNKVNCRALAGSRGVQDEEDLSWVHAFCPWSIDVDVDFNRSVFDSQFLGFEYRGFLDQIGFVPGLAASLKTNLGPVSLVAEWNGALQKSTFLDGQDRTISMTPSAWQLSLGYQIGWNPWVEAIGAQGTYFAIGYSQSSDLGGVLDSDGDRIGNVPRRRFVVGAGEWILEGFRIAVEYSHIWDYSTNRGGTGRSANGVFSLLTYEW